MKHILVIGAGKIGETIVQLLGCTSDYRVTVADRSDAALARIPTGSGIGKLKLDAGDGAAVRAAAAKAFAVISACPYSLTVGIAKAARDAGAHYLDLTEDVRSADDIGAIAQGADRAFIPQCGLAPGFVSIVAHDLARRFDSLDQVRMRVGALPRFPTNALKYNLTWSTEGLINEYCQPCEAIVGGEQVRTRALDGLEEFALDGVRYEAFNTSGGLGTMCRTYAGRVTTMDYRSIRYPGHRAIMRVLLRDLGLAGKQDLLKQILEEALPATMQDVVLVFVTVAGRQRGRLVQQSHVVQVHDQMLDQTHVSAIQITTASGVCAMLDLLVRGAFKKTGLIRQEDAGLAEFLDNRFGRIFNQSQPQAGQASALSRAS